MLWRGPATATGHRASAAAPSGWPAPSSGTLYELSPATGAVRSRIGIGGGLPHFPSVSLAGGTAFVGTLDGVVAVNGA